MSGKKKKPSAKPTAKKRAALVPQPHGGALLPGAGGGPQPGSGRPPSVIRQRLRGSFEDRIRILEEIIDDPTTSAADRIRAIDMLAKYGLGTQQEVSGPDGAPLFKVYRDVDTDDV